MHISFVFNGFLPIWKLININFDEKFLLFVIFNSDLNLIPLSTKYKNLEKKYSSHKNYMYVSIFVLFQVWILLKIFEKYFNNVTISIIYHFI